MNYKDGEAMNLNHISEVVKAGGKVSKVTFLSVLKKAYDLLNKDQVAGIISLVEKMLIAKSKGENLTVAFRDWNEDGSRRF